MKLKPTRFRKDFPRKRSYFLLPRPLCGRGSPRDEAATSYFSGRGFTLLQVLMVVSILLILGTVVFYSVVSSFSRSQAEKILSDYNMTKGAFRIWMADTDNFTFPRDSAYPDGPYGSSCLESEPMLSQTDLFSNVSSRSGWNGPYLTEPPIVPWGGKEYLYDNDNDTYTGDGSTKGVNFRFLWCNRTERKRGVEVIEIIDQRLDSGDGKNAGIVRWDSRDKGQADILIDHDRYAL